MQMAMTSFSTPSKISTTDMYTMFSLAMKSALYGAVMMVMKSMATVIIYTVSAAWSLAVSMFRTSKTIHCLHTSRALPDVQKEAVCEYFAYIIGLACAMVIGYVALRCYYESIREEAEHGNNASDHRIYSIVRYIQCVKNQACGI